MNRRSRFEIYMDIMMALTEGPKNPTRLMYTTNLSWTPLQDCLRTLLEQGFVTEIDHSSNRRAYVLMQKGKDIVDRYKDLLKDFCAISQESLLESSDIPML